MTAVMWSVAVCPRGSAALVSDRVPGPTMGAGSLSGWRWPQAAPAWTGWDEAIAQARAINAARGGRSDAQGQGARSPAASGAAAATEPDREDFYPRAASARQAAPQSPGRDDGRGQDCELDEDAFDADVRRAMAGETREEPPDGR